MDAFKTWVASSECPIPAGYSWGHPSVKALESAWLAATAAERERCAKLCDALSNDWHGHDGKYALEDAANKIRKP